MFTLKVVIVASIFVSLASPTLAQETPAPPDKPHETVPSAPPLVTATASGKRVRFVSPGSVVQLRLEVYNEAGQKLFDTELRGGNVLDWLVQDGAGERLPGGSYACVLTIKSLSGRLSQRVGLVTVNDKKTAVAPASPAGLSTAQQQVIGPVEENAAFTVLQQSDAEAMTAVTHDGSDGQMTSTKGALTFRTGDLFSGKDKEHMRITEDGKVGIGTDKPEATLDVAGSLRVSEGVRFSDGTTLDATSGKLTVRDANGNPVNVGGTKAAGTGTVNRVAKWTETGGAGTLGNSAITEASGNVVIGSGAQQGNLQIFGNANQDVFAGMGPDVNTGPAFNYGYAGLSIARSAGFFNVRPDPSATPPNPSLRFMTANVERMIVTNTGNVGIGVTLPSEKLEVSNGAVVSSGSTGGRFTTRNPNNQSALVHFDWFNDGATDWPRIRYGGGGVGATSGFLIQGPGDATKLAILNSGNVGIGTNAPVARLHVFGNTDDPAVPLAVIHSLGTQAPLSFRTGLSGVERARISVSGAGGLKIATLSGAAPDIHLDAGNDDGSDPDLFIESTTGNVGIGTTVPRLPLTVGFADTPVLLSALSGVFKAGGVFSIARDTTTDTEALFGADENGAVYGSITNHKVQLRTNNNTRMTIQTNGDVVFGNDTTIQADGDVVVGQLTNIANLTVTGRIFIGTNVGSDGPNLCLSESTGGIGICSSSLRYKKDVFRFTPGLNLISRLRPVSFHWKETGRADMGLIAEEVERVEPLLVTYNKGEVQGVKYDRLGVVLLNAVQEQQAQIKLQQQQLQAKDARITRLEARLAGFDRRLVSLDQRLRRRHQARHTKPN